MKKILAILFVFAASVASLDAQHYIGVKGGYGLAYSRTEAAPLVFNRWMFNKFSGGVMWKYYSSGKFTTGVEKVAGGIAVELEFMQQGYEYAEIKNGSNTIRRDVNSIIMPILWQPHINMAKDKFRIFLNVGVTFSYYMNYSYLHTVDDGTIVASERYTFKTFRDNMWGYGLCGGLGFNVVAGKFDILMEARYYFGFSDILKNSSKYPGNPIRSPLDSVNISLGVYYRIGKTPNIQQPGPNATRRRLERENAKNNQ